MAFGFPPKYVQDYQLDDVDNEQFLIYAIEAAKQLDWDVSFVSQTGFVAYTKFSFNSWSEEVLVNIDEGLVRVRSECTGSQLMDWGKNKRNVEGLHAKFEEVKLNMTPEDMDSKRTELTQIIATSQDEILNQPPAATKGKISGFFSLFKPTSGYFVTPVLIHFNILVFVAMLISGVHIMLPENQDLINWGANFRPVTLDGQWWRLFTACFIHIGVLHLLMNLYALVYIGLLLEPYLGKTRFLAAYVITGITASLTSLWWNELTISAGASGAIFGMYGVFLALLTTNLLNKSVKRALTTSIAVFVGYNLLNGLKPNSGIDNAAHIGGLISGLLVGYAFIPSLKKFENPIIKFSTIGVLLAILFVSTFSVYHTMPNDIVKYEKEMERFVHMESMAMEVYQMPEGTPDEQVLAEIKDRGLYYWNENIKLIDSFQGLDLPIPVKERNIKLREYCEIRIKSYELIYKTISEDTDMYQQQIDQCNQRIETLIAELTGKIQ